MLLIVFAVLGVVGIGAGIVALVRNVNQIWHPGGTGLTWPTVLTFASGLALAIASLFIVYPYSETVRIVGFPFPAAAWEKHGDRWRDFVGALTLPLYCANIVFAFVLPHLALRVLRRRAG
jgi:hypothetical protein